MQTDLPIVITFLGYLALILAIGFYAYKATSSLSDYVLGGRSLGPAVTALSVGASDMSGWLLLGLPGAIYLSGLSEIWIGIGLVIGAYFNWLLVAGRLRRFTENAGDALTLPEYFAQRFNDTSNVLKIVSAAMILIFFTFYVSSGLVAGARLFEEVFSLDYQYALWIGAFVIVSYTFLGGFLAVSWTDFFQGCLMLLALIVLPIAGIYELGGSANALNEITTIKQNSTSLFQDFETIGFISLMAWGLGYMGQPHILSRFMAIRSEADVPLSRNIAMAWMIVSLIGALAVGLIGIAIFKDAPLSNPETVFIMMTKVLLNPWVAGLLIAAIMSAVMSTIDSQLLVCSSVLVEDIYKSIFAKKASDKELVFAGRMAVLIVSVVALFIASNANSSVLSLVSYAWAGFGSAFGPVVLLSLYWPNLSKQGAVSSIITGGVVVVAWKQMNGGIFDLYEMVPGFIAAFLVAVVVSKLTTSPENEKRFNELSRLN